MLVIGAMAACSEDSGASEASGRSDPGSAGSGSEDSGPEGGTRDAAAPPVEEFEGSVDEFYEVPDPLPPGEPGDLIRTQPLDTAAGEAGLRIMYHSTDAQGDDRAVTGLLYYPTATPPEGGWPVLASAHGTTGIAPQCAPSRSPAPPESFGVEGVRVATDYIGLGPVGELHPYLDAAAEANAVLDSVTAAHNVEAAHAGDRWVLVGHSQGGHAALVTSERAAERLGDYELLGTVAVAPGSQFTELYGDAVQIKIITAMVMVGGAEDNPDFDPEDYLGKDALAAAERVTRSSCLGVIIPTMVPYAASPEFFVEDPMEEKEGPARDWLEENDPGQVRSDAPLLLMQGDRDVIVVPARTDALYERLCDIGQVVEFVELPGADHGTELPQGAVRISEWLADRLAGEPAPNTCVP